jgi:hypothetical protein
VPRPSSPLNAKASVRSPYALDRSQQNSCVGRLRVLQVTQLPPRPPCALVLSLPDYDVFSGSVLCNSLMKILEDLRSRTDPSFHDVKPARPLGLAGIRLLSSIAGWWSQTGSNRRPHACKARALPTELWPQSLETRQVVSCRSIRAPGWLTSSRGALRRKGW